MHFNCTQTDSVELQFCGVVTDAIRLKTTPIYGSIGLIAVSYTHLDVYKRQFHKNHYFVSGGWIVKCTVETNNVIMG